MWCSESAPCSLKARQRPAVTCGLVQGCGICLAGLNTQGGWSAYATAERGCVTCVAKGLCTHAIHEQKGLRLPIPAGRAPGSKDWISCKSNGCTPYRFNELINTVALSISDMSMPRLIAVYQWVKNQDTRLKRLLVRI
jgi:hypothetical protein